MASAIVHNHGSRGAMTSEIDPERSCTYAIGATASDPAVHSTGRNNTISQSRCAAAACAGGVRLVTHHTRPTAIAHFIERSIIAAALAATLPALRQAP